jgi:hypothetical protein
MKRAGKIFILTALSAACFLTFFSCKRDTNSIRFNTIVVEKQIPLLHEKDPELPYAEVEIRFTYPARFRDAQSLARLQQIFLGTFFNNVDFDMMTPQEAVNQFVAEYMERYKSLSNRFFDDRAQFGGEVPLWYWHSMSIVNNILFQSDLLLSYVVKHSEYSGGAHGNDLIINYNIDLKNLVTITEEDLFKPNYRQFLSKKIIHHLMSQFTVNEPSMLLENGFFTLEDIAPNSNFWLNREGIHYTFNRYEIADRATGIITVSIPFTELTEILLPDGIILRHFLNN